MPTHSWNKRRDVSHQTPEKKLLLLLNRLTLVSLLSLHRFEVDGRHGRDHLHGLRFHQTHVPAVPTSPLQEKPFDQDPLLGTGSDQRINACSAVKGTNWRHACHLCCSQQWVIVSRGDYEVPRERVHRYLQQQSKTTLMRTKQHHSRVPKNNSAQSASIKTSDVRLGSNPSNSHQPIKRDILHICFSPIIFLRLLFCQRFTFALLSTFSSFRLTFCKSCWFDSTSLQNWNLNLKEQSGSERLLLTRASSEGLFTQMHPNSFSKWNISDQFDGTRICTCTNKLSYFIKGWADQCGSI